MPAGFPKVLESNCIAYDNINTWYRIKIIPTGTGNKIYHIGTTSTPDGIIVWQEVLPGIIITLINPNKALFYGVVGETGATLSKIDIKYYNSV